MKRVLKVFLGLCVIVVLGVAATGAVLWYYWSSNLPYIGSLEEYHPPIITEVFSDDGELIGRFWEEKRIVVGMDEVPEHLIQAFIAAEDARFFEHEGVDPLSILRAFLKNLETGKISQGGSTITQQVTKSLLLKNPERTYRRKAREAILSLQIEKSFSKDRILFLYLNQIYLGHGAYGVEAAARTYFGKGAMELTLAESALLAGLPQAPSRYSPISHLDRARTRQKYVLERMRQEGYITAAQEQEALDVRLQIGEKDENAFVKAPYFAEHVRQYLEETYGRDVLYRGGLKVYTTLDLKMQRAAQAALLKGLEELDKREGYRGPLRHLTEKEAALFERKMAAELAVNPLQEGDSVEAVVREVRDQDKTVLLRVGNRSGLLPLSEMKWARKPNPEVPYYAAGIGKPSAALKAGDLVLTRVKGIDAASGDLQLSLDQQPLVQGALFCLEARTGLVRAMVGGRDFSASQFNRALQSKRQPGSSFKPIIYAAALDWGMSPATIIIDAPYISSMDPEAREDVWKPKNYKETFSGPTLLRTALVKSMNVITVKILRKIGVREAIGYARRLGIDSPLYPDLSLALGASGLSLAELTRAYAAFANGGMLVKPVFVKRIEDRAGRTLEENQPSMERVLSPETAYVMTDLLQAVIKEGTGGRVKPIKRPAGGKTGTTNDLRDAWFLGFTPSLVAGVWVGYDDHSPMNRAETGSRSASPIWLYFMTEVLKDRPVEDFSVPEGVVFAKIDRQTGLLAGPESKGTVFQAFKEGSEPRAYSKKPQAAKSGQFSQFDMDFK